MLMIPVMLPSVDHTDPAVPRAPRSTALWLKAPAEFTFVLYVYGHQAVNEHFKGQAG
jgi:hypothetical protein